MRKLIAVGHPEDIQLVTWLDLANRLGSVTFFLKVTEYPDCWRLSIDSGQGSICVLTKEGHRIALADPQNCWYLRGPGHAKRELLQTLQLLHSLLSLHAYPIGNYFVPLHAEGCIASKPLQLRLTQCQFPDTGISSSLRTRANWETVTKSISLERSTACRMGEVFSSHADAYLDAPLLSQDFVVGSNVKLHSYQCRTGFKLTFCAKAESHMVDYRVDESSSYSAISTPSVLEEITGVLHESTGCRFLDVDFIWHAEQPVFLEVNLGPAPTFFERAIFGSGYPYSQSVLSQWLRND